MFIKVQVQRNFTRDLFFLWKSARLLSVVCVVYRLRLLIQNKLYLYCTMFLCLHEFSIVPFERDWLSFRVCAFAIYIKWFSLIDHAATCTYVVGTIYASVCWDTFPKGNNRRTACAASVQSALRNVKCLRWCVQSACLQTIWWTVQFKFCVHRKSVFIFKIKWNADSKLVSFFCFVLFMAYLQLNPKIKNALNLLKFNPYFKIK